VSSDEAQRTQARMSNEQLARAIMRQRSKRVHAAQVLFGLFSQTVALLTVIYLLTRIDILS